MGWGAEDPLVSLLNLSMAPDTAEPASALSLFPQIEAGTSQATASPQSLGFLQHLAIEHPTQNTRASFSRGWETHSRKFTTLITQRRPRAHSLLCSWSHLISFKCGQIPSQIIWFGHAYTFPGTLNGLHSSWAALSWSAGGCVSGTGSKRPGQVNTE